MKKRLIIYILLIFWMGLIFFFSHQPAIESDKVSNGLINNLIEIVENITNHEFTDNEIQNIYEYAIFPVRKLAHLTIYLILGILIYQFAKEYIENHKKTFIISFLICIIYACSDEIHQLFVIGRSGELRDVLIDTFGSLLGIIIASKFFRKRDKNG